MFEMSCGFDVRGSQQAAPRPRRGRAASLSRGRRGEAEEGSVLGGVTGEGNNFAVEKFHVDHDASGFGDGHDFFQCIDTILHARLTIDTSV